MWYICARELFNLKKKRDSDTYYTMNEPQRCHTRLNNLATRTMTCHLCMVSIVDKLRNRKWNGTWQRLKDRIQEDGFKKYTELQFCKIKF